MAGLKTNAKPTEFLRRKEDPEALGPDAPAGMVRISRGLARLDPVRITHGSGLS